MIINDVSGRTNGPYPMPLQTTRRRPARRCFLINQGSLPHGNTQTLQSTRNNWNCDLSDAFPGFQNPISEVTNHNEFGVMMLTGAFSWVFSFYIPWKAKQRWTNLLQRRIVTPVLKVGVIWDSVLSVTTKNYIQAPVVTIIKDP